MNPVLKQLAASRMQVAVLHTALGTSIGDFIRLDESAEGGFPDDDVMRKARLALESSEGQYVTLAQDLHLMAHTLQNAPGDAGAAASRVIALLGPYEG